MALFVPFLFVISILFVFISFCAEELKNHLLCYKWLRIERRKIPLYILHDDWPCSGHIATSMFNLPFWLLIQNSELLKFLVNCLNIWELCKSINDLVSHVIPLKSVLLGMSTRKELVPLHRTNSQWLQCSEVGGGGERERVGWGLCLTLGIIDI